jgi:hypothetical protein
MIESESEERAVSDIDRNSDYAGELPYSIELWHAEARDTMKVLARAANASLANAIFRTACEENPERTIVLRVGDRVIAEAKAKPVA